MFGLQETNVPSKLYKFLTAPFFVENCLFRFSQPSVLNDPLEARPRLHKDGFSNDDYALARARTGAWDSSNDEHLMLALMPFGRRMDEKSYPGLWPAREPKLSDMPIQTIAELDDLVSDKAVKLCYQFVEDNLGILSLTANYSDPMWAHYGGNHAGVAVEFDTSHDFFVHQSLEYETESWEGRKKAVHRQYAVFEVQYSNDPISVTNVEGLLRVGGVQMNYKAVIDDCIQDVPLQLLLRKAASWAHEREWRMLRRLTDADEMSEDNDSKPLCLFNIPATAISAVIFGYKMTPDNVQTHVAAFKRQEKWHHISLRQRQITEMGDVVEVNL